MCSVEIYHLSRLHEIAAIALMYRPGKGFMAIPIKLLKPLVANSGLEPKRGKPAVAKSINRTVRMNLHVFIRSVDCHF